MYERIISEFHSTPWAIQPEKLAVMQDLLMYRASGGRLSQEEIQARIGAGQTAPIDRQQGQVAIIPLYGVVSQRLSMMQEISGGAGADSFAKRVDKAGQDPAVGAIILDIDSPGGSVYGIQEAASTVAKYRGQKKIVAVANSLAASAAYWIATAADEIVVTPGGEVGSIGVLTAHTDMSEYLERAGVKTTLISAGKYKVEGNPYGPLDGKAQTAIQKRVDEYYDEFVKAVATNRGTTPAEVRGGYAQGRTVGAREAVSLNMADRVGTLEETIQRLAGSRQAQRPRRRAEAELRQLEYGA